MKINGINSHNIMNLYNNTRIKVADEANVNKVSQTDKVQISDFGKALSSYMKNDNIDFDRTEKIARLKEQVQNGTYNVDAKLTARSILDNIEGRNI